jgi:hypothetical protein
MTTTHITQSLLNNVARTNAIIALNSSSTTINNSIIIYFLIALVVAFAGFGAWVIWDTWYR